ncbi:alpha/beta fold hydrolase [Thalassotalea marina]|uniref:Acyl-CoA esterase n=1 Tax=Thalassotalea marina TaxID=1673741 RepID=A0A919BN85_9GAMM|nr:alpha/beta fold hydrolase [Thalassotalea marina]GHG01119.1 acyl-CoA esterase [Thalassotalea marina]
MATLHHVQQGQGPHLLLIHGLLGSLENLNMVAKPMASHFTVTNVDVRNHGNSVHLPDMHYDELAQDIIDTMDSLNIDKAHVLGHSMGGKIAMQLALEHPARVNKLAVADIAPVQYSAHHEQIFAGLNAIDLAAIKSRTDADKTLAQYVETPSVRQFLLRNLTKTEQGFAFKCNLDYLTQGYSQIMTAYQGNSTFNSPTLFIKGGESNYITSEHRAKINQLFPHAKAKIIQGAGHWLHAEKTVAFNKILLDFLLDQ